MDINEAIREVIALTQAELQRNGVRLQTRLADGLPLVPGDRVQLQQVMVNLIVNAVEAMSGASDGPRELTIVSGADDSNDVFVEVQDTGPGLDPAKLDRLFQSFYTTKPDGMGMGLAISRSIVEAHGGRLSAAPNKPRGAVFRFTLPIEETFGDPGGPSRSRSADAGVGRPSEGVPGLYSSIIAISRSAGRSFLLAARTDASAMAEAHAAHYFLVRIRDRNCQGKPS